MALLDALLGGASTTKYDVNPALNQVNQSKQTQQGILNTGTAKLGALNAPYTSSIANTGNTYQDLTNKAGTNYVNNVVNAGDAANSSLSQALQRNVMGAQPAINDQLRESLAATGGLNRGAADQAFIKSGQQAAQNIFEGNQSLNNQALANRTAALGTAYNNENGTINTRFGNDVGATNNVYGSNRTDIGNNTSGQLGIEQGANNNILDLLGAQQNSNVAASTAGNNSNNALLGALLGAGGTAAGAYFGGPAGAKLGQQLTTSTGPRGSVQQVA